MTRPLLLASASPRRRELLAQLGLQFTVAPVGIDESPRPGEAPAALVSRLSRAKAEVALAAADPQQWVLGADTVVAVGQEILGKPGNGAAAAAMLRRLSGRGHTVYTGLHLARRNHSGHGRTVRTRVRMRVIEDSEISAYVATGEPLGKAGAYAIQGRAAAFVRCIAGSYSNVVGLPLFELDAMLRGLPDPPGRFSTPRTP
ncbi:Maf family protein [Thioalkalivibrio sp.]|uniref:Maf family protein n=1 Tax=Thioalkalivibrio sp. TaxID=2093813 RepID=UPI0035675784